METKEETEKRFYVKSTDDLLSLGRITVLVDRNTAVNYLHAWVGTGSRITALLD
ncbi:DUF6440 family protein [Sporosarcina sp. P3]|uniref:DUF6440 family protein n=1 Tax=Sporosarcina sp. P3 TaxID=2048245 RepID=UPI0018EA629F|nr:DUF6440 family protein [Sporosarcina sp. P3]